MQVTDPVCGMQIDTAKAAAIEVLQNQTYYFCSVECFEAFRQKPERYVKKPVETGNGRGSESHRG